jgi:hypothetical protein
MSYEDKSHVGMGHMLCPVCWKKHDEVVLLDKRLRKTLTRDMHMGLKLCPEHEAMSSEYLALVETANVPERGKTMREEEMRFDSTCRSVQIRRSVWPHIFGGPAPDLPFVVGEKGIVAKLEAMQRAGEEAQQEGGKPC